MLFGLELWGRKGLKQSSTLKEEMMYVILAGIQCMYIREKTKDDVDSLLAGMLL